MTVRMPVAADRTSRSGAAMAVLLGVAAGMVMVGFKDAFLGARGAPTMEGHTIIGIMLLAVAVGVRLPHRLATWIGATALRRLIGRHDDPIDEPEILLRGPIDPTLHWTVLAVIALAFGLTSALSPLLIDVTLRVGAWAAAHFVWSDVPRAFCEALVALLCALLPLSLLGLASTCTYHLLCRHGQWEPRAGSYHLLGGAAGMCVALLFKSFQVRPAIILMASAIPALCVAAVSAGILASAGAGRRGMVVGGGGGGGGGGGAPSPARLDHWPALLRGSVCVVAVAATMWVHAAMFRGAETSALVLLQRSALLMACLGIGSVVGTLKQSPEAYSIGGFGAACAAAGAVTALVAIALNHRLIAIGHPALVHMVCGLGTMATGYAMAVGKKTLLSQVGSRSSVGTKALARMLVACALSVAVATPIIRGHLGFSAMLAAIGFGLLALGGTLVIHEPGYSTATRRIRLGAIFGAIGLMITISLCQP